MIKVGDKLPDGTLNEFLETEQPGCSVGPNSFSVAQLTKGKKIVVFGLPGAFTPTCSAKHVPGYLAGFEQLKGKGVDEIWCVSVNDAFVMGAWARDQKSQGKVRMMADGSAAFTKALGLELDLTARGMGVRSNRYPAVTCATRTPGFLADSVAMAREPERERFRAHMTSTRTSSTSQNEREHKLEHACSNYWN